MEIHAGLWNVSTSLVYSQQGVRKDAIVPIGSSGQIVDRIKWADGKARWPAASDDEMLPAREGVLRLTLGAAEDHPDKATTVQQAHNDSSSDDENATAAGPILLGSQGAEDHQRVRAVSPPRRQETLNKKERDALATSSRDLRLVDGTVSRMLIPKFGMGATANIIRTISTLIHQKKLPVIRSGSTYEDYVKIPWAEHEFLDGGEHEGSTFSGVTAQQLLDTFKLVCGPHLDDNLRNWPPRVQGNAGSRVANNALSQSTALSRALERMSDQIGQGRATSRELPEGDIAAAQVVLATARRVWALADPAPATDLPVLPMIDRLTRFLQETAIDWSDVAPNGPLKTYFGENEWPAKHVPGGRIQKSHDAGEGLMVSTEEEHRESLARHVLTLLGVYAGAVVRPTDVAYMLGQLGSFSRGGRDDDY